MPTKWDSQAYLNVYPDLVKQMDPPSTRNKCFARGLIDAEQRNDLSDLKGSGHNRGLLKLLGKLNDDKYEVFCQVLLDNAIHMHDGSVAEMRKSPGALADPDPIMAIPIRWQSKVFIKETAELERQMDPSGMRTKCYVEGLITTKQKNELALLQGAKHNRELIALLEKRTDDEYDVFCKILLANDIHLHDDSVKRLKKASVPPPESDATSSATGQLEAAPASASTGKLEGNPFKTDEYMDIRLDLMHDMDMSAVSTTAEATGLIERYQLDDLKSKFKANEKPQHNRQLFTLIEAGGGMERIRKFSKKVLPRLGQCEGHKAALDSLLDMYK